MWPNPQETMDLVTFTAEILNGKLHFLCSVLNHCMLLFTCMLLYDNFFGVYHHATNKIRNQFVLRTSNKFMIRKSNLIFNMHDVWEVKRIFELQVFRFLLPLFRVMFILLDQKIPQVSQNFESKRVEILQLYDIC